MAKRRLSVAELAQRQKAAVARGRQISGKRYTDPTSEERKAKRSARADAQVRTDEHREFARTHDYDEHREEFNRSLDRREAAVLAALKRHGMSHRFIVVWHLDVASWDNSALQYVVGAWDRLIRLGLTRVQAERRLEARLSRTQKKTEINQRPHMMDLIRDTYKKVPGRPFQNMRKRSRKAWNVSRNK
jgi:hypothetical protein